MAEVTNSNADLYGLVLVTERDGAGLAHLVRVEERPIAAWETVDGYLARPICVGGHADMVYDKTTGGVIDIATGRVHQNVETALDARFPGASQRLQLQAPGET